MEPAASRMADEGLTQMAEDVLRGNMHSQDSRLVVKFYMGALENSSKSADAGRPIFDDVEFVRIITPGQKDIYDQPVWDGTRQRFPKQYAAFKQGLEQVQSGTPLTVWPVVKASQIAELAARSVRTVEQLAGMADIDAQQWPGMHSLRQKAKDFIEAAKQSAPLTKMREELEQRDAKLAALESQNQQMQAQLSELVGHANRAAEREPAAPKAKRGRGRPAKQAEAPIEE